MNLVYRGHGLVGDLWCYRHEPGVITSVFEPTSIELAELNRGGRVRLTLMTEPIPPISLDVLSAEDSEPIAPHHYKVIPELDDEARN
jgi:hypothetical protein